MNNPKDTCIITTDATQALQILNKCVSSQGRMGHSVKAFNCIIDDGVYEINISWSSQKENDKVD